MGIFTKKEKKSLAERLASLNQKEREKAMAEVEKRRDKEILSVLKAAISQLCEKEDAVLFDIRITSFSYPNDNWNHILLEMARNGTMENKPSEAQQAILNSTPDTSYVVYELKKMDPKIYALYQLLGTHLHMQAVLISEGVIPRELFSL